MDGSKMLPSGTRKMKPGSCFDIEEIIDRVSEQTGTNRRLVKNIAYTQWFMVRSVMLFGNFYYCILKGMGVFILRDVAERKKKGDIVTWKDPFMRMPYHMLDRCKRKGLHMGNPLHRKTSSVIFKELDELGQRYYVLER